VKMRLAILGSRGIPAQYGGFETFAEEVSVRLVRMGFEVTVFCQSEQKRPDRTYRGVNLCYLKVSVSGGIGQLLYDLSCLWQSRKGYDVVYLLGYAAAFLAFLPRLYGNEVWINPDGLEWKRAKWNFTKRALIRIFELWATIMPNRLVCDCDAMLKNLYTRYRRLPPSTVIPYGTMLVDRACPPAPEILREWNLTPGNYYLVVCRLEPENQVLEIVDGYVRSNSKIPLAVISNIPDTSYAREIREVADDRVKFLGTVYHREKLQAIRYHSCAYFHGHTVGGTNPSLLEAMGCANVVVAHDNEFNREVLGDSALFFRYPKDIPGILDRIVSCGQELRDRTFRRASERYHWDLIAEQYAALLQSEHKPTAVTGSLRSQEIVSARYGPD
jgi:glycosyltransferase involved in cell wall biosynthesis